MSKLELLLISLGSEFQNLKWLILEKSLHLLILKENQTSKF